MSMNFARGLICWRDFDGVKKRICDRDNGPPEFQCPDAATKILINDRGDSIHACSEDCLRFLVPWAFNDEPREIELVATTRDGIEVYVSTSD